MNKEIKLIDWGLIEYNQAWTQQESIFSETINRKVEGLDTENVLVFCEHPHVYTLGKRAMNIICYWIIFNFRLKKLFL